MNSGMNPCNDGLLGRGRWRRWLTQLLLGLCIVFLCSAVSSAEVGGLTRTIVVCDASTTISTTSSSGTASSVSLESGGTYLLSACNVVVTLLSTNTIELQDVAIVVRGGSALPAVMVSSTMVRNLTIDVADVVAVGTAATPRVVFFGQVTTAENITVTLRNVEIYNAMDVSIVDFTAWNAAHGLTVTLSDCILSNVTTRGLVAASGSVATTTVSFLSITVSGGQYSLTLISSGWVRGGVLMQLSDFSLLTDTMILARGVSLHVTVTSNTGDDINVGAVATVTRVNRVTTTHITVEGVDVVGVIEEDLIRTTFSVVRMEDIFVSIRDCSIIARSSRFHGLAGTPRGILVQGVALVESVLIEVHTTSISLVAHGLVEHQPGYFQGIVAAAVAVGNIQQIMNYTVVMSDCSVDVAVTNSSLLQSYSGMTCASVTWYGVLSTAALDVRMERVRMNVTVRYASVALVLSPYAPVLGILTVGIAAFSSSGSAFQNSTIVVSYVSLFSDLAIIPPTVPPDAYPLLMAPLLAVDVTTGVVVSTSNWTTSHISVVLSRIVVQQLRFVISPSAAAVSVGSATNCKAIYLSNTSGMVVFHSGMQEYQDACMSAISVFVAAGRSSTYFTPSVMEMVRVNVRDCDVEPAVSMLDSVTTGVRIWPQIFSTTLFLPPTVTNCSVSVSNVSSVGLSSMLNGPAIALSGTHLTGFNATLNDVTGFPLGMVWSIYEAGSTIQSSSILAVSVDASGGGGVLAGNVTAVAPVVVTLRNCVLSSGGSGLFGDGSTRWRTAAAGGRSSSSGVENASLPSSVFLLQGCNTWNGHPLTLQLARRLLREAINVPPGAVAVQTEGQGGGSNCVATATLEVIRPLPVSRVSSMTGAVAVAAMALSAASSPSTVSVAGMLRLQAMFGSLRVGRRCYQATSGGAATDDDSSGSDDVGSAVFDNPLQLVVPVQDSSLQYAAGCVIGNTILIAVAMILLNVPSAASMVTRAGASTLAARAWLLLRHLVLDTAPGHGVVALLLLLTPTVTSAIALGASTDDAPTVVVGAAGVLFYGVGPFVLVGILMWRFPLRTCVVKRAVLRPRYALQRLAVAVGRLMFEETSQWVPYQPSKGSLNSFSRRFRHRFGVLFVGYRSGCHWYSAVDVVVPVLTGVLCGLPAGSVSCSLVLYVLLGLSFVACMGSVLLRPCMTRWDNLWAVVGNGFSVAVTALIVSEQMSAANIAATALAWLSLVPTLASVSQLLHRVFLTMMGTTNRTDGRHVVARAVVGAQQGDGALSLSSSSLDVSLASIVASEKRIAMNESLILLVTLVCTRQQQISNV